MVGNVRNVGCDFGETIVSNKDISPDTTAVKIDPRIFIDGPFKPGIRPIGPNNPIKPIGPYVTSPVESKGRISVTDENGNKTTFVQTGNGKYFVTTVDKNGKIKSLDVQDKDEALGNFMDLAQNDDVESITRTDSKGSKTTVSVDEDGDYEVTRSGHPGLITENEISEAGAIHTVVGMLEDIGMVEDEKKHPTIMYSA